MKKKHVRIIYGPTASGKNAHALKIAQNEDVVIINADAMQCYNALPILTAQPDANERTQAPHELYGVISPENNLIVTDWIDLAVHEINLAFTTELTPLIVGGTGLYIKALIEGLSPVPDVPENIRKEGEHRIAKEGLSSLYQDLYNINSEHAARLDENNPRRVLRAWEIWRATGDTLQTWQDKPRIPPLKDIDFEIIPILRPRTELVERINLRFDKMIEKGVLDEIKALSDLIESGNVSENALITKAHGFRPLRAYLKGTVSLAEAISQSKAETRQYAKRQMTWLRGQFGIKTYS